MWMMLGQGVAATPAVGVQLSAAKDLPDGGSLGPQDGASWGLGKGIGLSYSHSVVPKLVGMKASFTVDLAEGVDQVRWGDDQLDAERDARLAWLYFSLGPELTVPTLDEDVEPFFGAGLGLGVVHARHPFDGSGPDGQWPYLQEEGVEGLGPGVNIDMAQSTQLLPGASAWGGLRIWVREGMAIDLESGYTVCHVPPSGLKARPYSFQVTRSEFGLNVFRLGLGVTVGLPSRE